MRVDQDFLSQLAGEGLLTAEVTYYRPDHPRLLQTFVWQVMDSAPQYPRLSRFLDHWRTEINAMIHSIRVAHNDEMGPRQFRLNPDELTLN